MQATAYLKRRNEGFALDPAEHLMRMEVTLERSGLMEFGIDHLSDLLGLSYRPTAGGERRHDEHRTLGCNQMRPLMKHHERQQPGRRFGRGRCCGAPRSVVPFAWQSQDMDQWLAGTMKQAQELLRVSAVEMLDAAPA